MPVGWTLSLPSGDCTRFSEDALSSLSLRYDFAKVGGITVTRHLESGGWEQDRRLTKLGDFAILPNARAS